MLVGYEDYKHNYDFSGVRGVIHVGAHHGQEHGEYLAEYGDISTHWFEPGAEAFEVLKENLGNAQGAEIYNFALVQSLVNYLSGPKQSTADRVHR